MKVFISWSGTQSHSIALALKGWLPFIFTDIQAFVSSEDVRKGKRWLPEISKELSSTNFGIVCLTPSNLDACWILFEAGALSKLKSAQVCTLLFGDLRNADIQGPLSHFQSTPFNKAEFLKLIQSINSKQGKSRLEDQRLKTMFEKWWPDLEKLIAESIEESETTAEPKRSAEEMLAELLEITREIARNVRSIDTPDQEYQKLRKLLSLPVEEIELPESSVISLQKAKIFTVGQLANNTERELIKRTYLGPRRINQIKEQLAQLGLTLGMVFEEGLLKS